MAGEDGPLVPSSSSHRLPTVSASQALQNLYARGARAVSTGISQLDKVLSVPSLPGHDAPGGYLRGKVTEIFGPSGVGKTSFGIQAAVSALREGQQVVWVDAACAPLVRERLDSVLESSKGDGHSREPGTDPAPTSTGVGDELCSRFHYFAAPTLAHLLALFVHSPASFPPQDTSLVVVDSLATLVDNAYPRNPDARMARVKTEQSRWAAGRRFAIINELISTFARFAATHDIALLLTSQTITRIRGASRAVLVPAMSGVEWENGISTRLVLFRDWAPGESTKNKSEVARLRRARFVGLTKANGVALAEEGGVGNVVAFTIEHSGLQHLNISADNITAPVTSSPHARPPKRPASEIDEDSEGLLIDDLPIIDEDGRAGTCLEVVTEGRSKKVARTTTV